MGWNRIKRALGRQHRKNPMGGEARRYQDTKDPRTEDH